MGNSIPGKGRRKLKDFVSWFEIPVYDIRRATAFYNTIYQINMETNESGDFAMSFFPADRGVGGALVAGPGCTPNSTGPLIYLNAGDDMDSILSRVDGAGGRVIMNRSMISESAGSFALFIDSEGNRLALHEEPRTRRDTPKSVSDRVPAGAKVFTKGSSQRSAKPSVAKSRDASVSRSGAKSGAKSGIPTGSKGKGGGTPATLGKNARKKAEKKAAASRR